MIKKIRNTISALHPTYLLSIAAICFLILNKVNAQVPNLTIIGDTTPPVSQANSYFNITNLSYQLLLTHIKIGNSQGDINLMDLDTQTDILDTINTSETLAKLDIITTLKAAKDPTTTFTNYLNAISTAISKSNFFIMLAGETVANKQVEMATCIAEKKTADATYFNSLSYYDQTTLISSLQQSMAYDKCISQAKVIINANNAILDKLNLYNNLLNTKYIYLTDKQDTILANVQVIDPVLLQELQNIDKTLTEYNQ